MDDDLDAEKDESDGFKIVTTCVQKYPQIIDDKDQPRLAYWTCNNVIKDYCCITTFKGCGRNICDLHCHKFTNFGTV